MFAYICVYLVFFHLLEVSETTCFVTDLFRIGLLLLHQERPTETVLLSISSKEWY